MARRSTSQKQGTPHHRRLRTLRAAARKQGVDHVLVTNPRDVGYLTGFLGGDSYLLVGRGKPILISDGRYEAELTPFKPLARVHIRDGSMVDAVRDVFKTLGVERCGFQAEHVTVDGRAGLAKAVGARRLRAVSGLVTNLRTVKDEHEIKLIRRAIRLQEQALLAVLPTIEAGQSELEIAARLEAEMKSRGSSEPGFNTIVGTGANRPLPHYRPGNVRIRKNTALLIDWGSVFQGYHGDMTRTFVIGRWPRAIREIYQIVLDAHEMAAAALKPGVLSREVDAIARDHIARHGYGKEFGHSLGHGMGLDGHEGPRLSRMAGQETLCPGHVVTVEPGIYLPGVGGVRIEDDYLITERGARNLCSLPRTLEWATL